LEEKPKERITPKEEQGFYSAFKKGLVIVAVIFSCAC